MLVLNPAERRAAGIVVALLLLGSGRDLWRALDPQRTSRPLVVHQAVRGALASGGDARDGAADPDPFASRSRAAEHDGGPHDAGHDPVRAAPRLDLNRATVEELDALPGLGPVLAGRIVEYRRQHGNFRTVEELRVVRGIGPRLLARLSPRVAIGEPQEH